MSTPTAYHVHRIGTPSDIINGQFFCEKDWLDDMDNGGWVSFAESDRISFEEYDGNRWNLFDGAEWYPVWEEK